MRLPAPSIRMPRLNPWASTTAARLWVPRSASALSMGTRISLPAKKYVPGATRISSPLAAASMAGWMAVAAMDQLVYGTSGVAFETST